MTRDALAYTAVAVIAAIAVATFGLPPAIEAAPRSLHAKLKLRRLWPTLAGNTARLGTDSAALHAPAAVVEFGDYECEACAASHQAMMEAATRHPGGLGAVAYLHAPPRSPSSRRAALAAICADEQGVFAPFHDLVFRRQPWQGEMDWHATALLAGVADTAAFSLCLDGDRARRRLAAEGQYAKELQIRGTPFFVTRTGMSIGIPDSELLNQLLDN